MTIRKILTVTAAVLAVGTLFGASAATAQTPVAFQQRHFGSHSDGSSNAAAVPCCTAMGTYDQRTVSSKQPPNPENRGGPFHSEFNLRRQYGTATVQDILPNGQRPVTIPSGIFETMSSLPFIELPGGNLFGIDTRITRTLMELNFAPGGGIGANHIGTADFTSQALADGNDFFQYVAADHVAQTAPTFRDGTTTTTTSMGAVNTGVPTWAGPYASQAGRIRVSPSPDQYGGLRNMLWDQFSHGFVPGPTTATAAEFNFVVRYGPGAPLEAQFGYNFTTPPTTVVPTTNNFFTATDVLRRSTSSAPFKLRNTPGTQGSCCTGATIVSLAGTGWFTFADFTTGTIQVLANTIGTIFNDFSTRTEMGSYAISTTSMGAIVGQMQLVSGGLLNSRGAQPANLAHTHNTQIKFAPEPGSAALIGAGALGLFGLMIRDRKRNRG